MNNPNTIAASNQQQVTSATELRRATIDYNSGGRISLTVHAEQTVVVDGTTYSSGGWQGVEAIAPSFEASIQSTVAMFAAEPDADEWTPGLVEQFFTKMGRYFSHFHTTVSAQKEVIADPEQPQPPLSYGVDTE